MKESCKCPLILVGQQMGGLVGLGTENEKVGLFQEVGELLVPSHPCRSAVGRTGGGEGEGGGLGEEKREGLGYSKGSAG